jgi:hypothetical protein
MFYNELSRSQHGIAPVGFNRASWGAGHRLQIGMVTDPSHFAQLRDLAAHFARVLL